VRLAAIVVLTVVLAGGCRNEGLTLISESDLPEDVYGSPAPTPAETPDIPDQGTVYLVRDQRLHPKTRTLQPTADSVAEALILALIPPPTGRQVTTAIPATTQLNEVRVDGVVATVDLSSEFEAAAPREQQRLRIAQVVYTLTQEGTGINAVRISIDGVPQQLNELDVPADREDYPGVAPPNEGQR
jgi:hypothetical protein